MITRKRARAGISVPVLHVEKLKLQEAQQHSLEEARWRPGPGALRHTRQDEGITEPCAAVSYTKRKPEIHVAFSGALQARHLIL